MLPRLSVSRHPDIAGVDPHRDGLCKRGLGHGGSSPLVVLPYKRDGNPLHGGSDITTPTFFTCLRLHEPGVAPRTAEADGRERHQHLTNAPAVAPAGTVGTRQAGRTTARREDDCGTDHRPGVTAFRAAAEVGGWPGGDGNNVPCGQPYGSSRGTSLVRLHGVSFRDRLVGPAGPSTCDPVWPVPWRLPPSGLVVHYSEHDT
ncbi:hypothetical protein PD653_3009 [Nocardioides sp. PD653]|nr:hypothetical protein PD653B2_4890 [Nocardioides sp. PD653-B2]GAW55584.1 hypothetical protein PD653_3009 [Nocardioides sp. PD653]